jgi:hypothetical protein
VFRTLFLCSPENLLFYEQRAIDVLQPELNTRKIAHSNLGVRWSAETNAKKHPHCARYTVQGVTGTVEELRRHFGAVSSSCAAWRVQHGWSVEAAVTHPPATMKERGATSAVARSVAGTHPREKPLQFRGDMLPLHKLVAKYSSHAYKTVVQRILRGKSLEEALTAPLRTWR